LVLVSALLDRRRFPITVVVGELRVRGLLQQGLDQLLERERAPQRKHRVRVVDRRYAGMHHVGRLASRCAAPPPSRPACDQA
jgi:hypothetical protein